MTTRNRLAMEIRRDIKVQEKQLEDFLNQADQALREEHNDNWRFWSNEVLWLLEKIEHNRTLLTMLEHY